MPGLLKSTLGRDGVTRYYYNRATGERYGTDKEVAMAHAKAWQAGQVVSQPISVGPTLDDAIVHYYKQAIGKRAFLRKAPRTQQLYRLYLEQLREQMGNTPLAGIDRLTCQNIRDALAGHPGKCYGTLAGLQIVLNLAIDDGMMSGPNPVKRVERVERNSRSQIWTLEQVDAFLAVARPSLQLACLLLLYTAQRPCDVLAMTRGHVSEEGGRLYIATRQKKTGQLVDLPVPRQLEPALRKRLADPSGGMMLVSSPRGLPWAQRNFSTAWDEARKAAGLPHLQRRDLRRTAVVYLAQKGASVPQIAQITGHSLKSVETMLDKVYLPRRREIALAGVELWESGDRPKFDSTVVDLALGRAKR